MSDTSEHDAIDGRGFGAVDEQPDPSYLVATMEVTATWPAVRTLRAWEHERLAVGPGDALLDVGCGIGEVVRAYASSVQPGGRAVGIDTSEAMLDVARQRAADVGVDATFRVGDAFAIDEPHGSFDACRAERVLQWLQDPRAAVQEMLRVLRPGGRLCLIDTDWRTFTADLPDLGVASRVNDTVVAFRGEGAAMGGQLLNLCRDAGLVDLDVASAAHVWTAWDPDTQLGPPGLFPMHDLFEQVVAAGQLDAAEASRLLDALEHAARADRLVLSVTMTAVCGLKP